MSSGSVASATSALELIRAGLTELAACDLDAYSTDGLGEECARILRAVGELQLEAVRRLARFEALGGPASGGAPSLQAWLGHRCRLRPWEAKQLATSATRLHLLDETRAVFESGEIEFGDVATIAEGVDKAADTMPPDTMPPDTMPPETTAPDTASGWTPERIAKIAQPILLEAAGEVTPGQLRKAAARVALTLNGENAERRRAQIERQSFLDIGQTMDGVGVLRGDLGAADFAILEKTIDAFAPRPDPGSPRWESRPGHRRLKGLVAACEVALKTAGCHGYRERGGAPVRVHLIATPATLDPGVPAVQAPPGRTEYGSVISATQIREMLRRHHAIISKIHLGPDGRVIDRFTTHGQPLNWGRTRRLFTPAQRDIYLAVYAGCAAEGCDRPPAWADIDHKRAWAGGGRTDLDNGQPLCRWHNLEKEHGYRHYARRRRAGPDASRLRQPPPEARGEG
ncbi:hypothetical protein GCM10027176_26830 [Actinoallomurus bryophytorum]|uniref:Uncharacterized protein DUF222 n=1 Tax=Actinoallomurus bryophytorum TaxID=1490222 RepID=A0A543CQB7_9ACTN|nr:HNH endonuclease signature motif containing protein [Actinoallomurus bryophytorum]TQL99117.1 uncharacterized protein DUF222 [Actinoallomurus bryophytorum]